MKFPNWKSVVVSSQTVERKVPQSRINRVVGFAKRNLNQGKRSEKKLQQLNELPIAEGNSTSFTFKAQAKLLDFQKLEVKRRAKRAEKNFNNYLAQAKEFGEKNNRLDDQRSV
jgi:hypothetical protein